MDYNKLSTFVAVARYGSISKAADSLFRTQPAITQQIQALEEDLELKLLERKHGRVYLTKQGQGLYKFASHRLKEIDDFMVEVKNDSESLTGEIRIGIRPDVAMQLLPTVFYKFRQNYPRIKFTVLHGDSATTEKRLLDNQIDIGVQLLVKDQSLIKSFSIHAKPAILAAGAKYLEKFGVPKKPEELLNHVLIDFTEDCDAIAQWISSTDRKVETALRKNGPHYICPDHGFAAELVKKNIGICAMPIYFIEKEFKSGAVKQLMAKIFEGDLSFNVVVRRNATQTAAEKAFLKTLLAK